MADFTTFRGKIKVTVAPEDVENIRGIAALSDHFHTGFLGHTPDAQRTEITRRDGGKYVVSGHHMDVCAALNFTPP
jgi:hypothetical protein